jgi:hypothetical protein
MNRPAVISILAFVGLFIMHHDFWNWGNTTLVTQELIPNPSSVQGFAFASPLKKKLRI